MAQLYLDMADVSAIPAPWQHDSAGLMQRAGINLGNFAFRHALPVMLADFAEFTPVTYTDYLHAAEAGPIDHVLVSCANWLDQGAEVERNNGFRANVFEKARAVTCFGLGVQARSDTTQAQLGPETLRMVRALSERATQISVRDTLTRDTLMTAGIANVVVTGCPSNFINPDPALGAGIAATAARLAGEAPGWDEVRSLISEASGGHGKSGEVITAQLRLMERHPAFYVLQSPALLPFTLGESRAVPPLYASHSPFGEDSARLTRALRRAVLHFASVDGWMDFARSCDLAFGMRIHGTMVPLQAGVPSILITHDSRTAGLAQQMQIPAVTPEAYLAAQTQGPVALLDTISAQMPVYDSRRQQLAEVMCRYITDNGLRPHTALRGLAQA